MATYLNLADKMKQTGDDHGVTSMIIEMLAQTNPILQDMTVVECNDGSSNKTVIRTGLPTAAWTAYYKGVQPSKSETAQVVDTTGSLKAWSEIDAELVDKSVNGNQLRLNEAQAFLEAMNNTMATTLFYGSEAEEIKSFTGLSPRFSKLTGAKNSSQVIDAGGSGSNNTSIWFIVWGERTCHGLYPKGSRAGLSREDKGKQTREDADGGLYDVYREKFSWDLGLTVKDWRYVARICNIDVANAQAGKVDLFKFMRKAYYALKQRQIAGGQAAIYCNKDMMEVLDALATNNGTTDNFVRLKTTEIEGKEVMSYRGIPIREVDALVNTEKKVS